MKRLIRQRLLKPFEGHLWTLFPHLGRRLNPRSLTHTQTFSTPFTCQNGRSLTVDGLFDQGECQDTLFVIFHGIGSNPNAEYAQAAAGAMRPRGSVLRIALRGSWGAQPDFYHGGLTEDLHAALAAPELAHFRRIFLVGFSLGGHVALRYCTEDGDERVKAVVGICPPLSLGAGQRRLDHWSMWIYRQHILRGLLRTYTACYNAALPQGIVLPNAPDDLRAVKTIQEWDSKTVVPRFGFDSVDHYYEAASVSHRLKELRVPGLIIAGRYDPIVPYVDMAPHLGHKPDHLEIQVFDHAGHVGFPSKIALGESAPRKLYDQIGHWCMRTQD